MPDDPRGIRGGPATPPRTIQTPWLPPRFAADKNKSDREHLARLESIDAEAATVTTSGAVVTPETSPPKTDPAAPETKAPDEDRPSDGLGDFPDFGI